jgi:large subunit ribosomal protein L4e
MARGHVVDEVPEIPLILEDAIDTTKKTSAAQEILASVGALEDVEKVIKSKKIRAGKGKARNRRYVKRRGPLVIYDSNQSEIRLGFRNLPGVELCCVDRLNLLQLAPGGHLGRFIIWSQSAANRLDSIYKAEGRKEIPCIMSNADHARIINSDEIQSTLIPCKETPRVYAKKRNPLKRTDALEALNPYAAEVKRAEARAAEARKGKKEEILATQRAKAAEKRKISDANQKFYEEARKQGDVCKDGFNL